MANLLCFKRAHREQTIDEESISAWRRYSASGRMRTGDIAELFQVSHYVTHRSGRKIKAENLESALEPTGWPSAM